MNRFFPTASNSEEGPEFPLAMDCVVGAVVVGGNVVWMTKFSEEKGREKKFFKVFSYINLIRDASISFFWPHLLLYSGGKSRSQKVKVLPCVSPTHYLSQLIGSTSRMKNFAAKKNHLFFLNLGFPPLILRHSICANMHTNSREPHCYTMKNLEDHLD